MNTPSPDGHADDQPRQRLECTFPALCIYLADPLQDLCFVEEFVDEINYDEFGNRLGDPPFYEGPYEYDPNFEPGFVGRHINPTIGVWLNKDGSITPPPLPPG